MSENKVTLRTQGLLPQDRDVAEVWVGQDQKIHIRMLVDNAFDIVFEDSDRVKPRQVFWFPSKKETP